MSEVDRIVKNPGHVWKRLFTLMGEIDPPVWRCRNCKVETDEISKGNLRQCIRIDTLTLNDQHLIPKHWPIMTMHLKASDNQDQGMLQLKKADTPNADYVLWIDRQMAIQMRDQLNLILQVLPNEA